jgi:hypothetical protein
MLRPLGNDLLAEQQAIPDIGINSVVSLVYVL